jgi:hypothetical protein
MTTQQRPNDSMMNGINNMNSTLEKSTPLGNSQLENSRHE